MKEGEGGGEEIDVSQMLLLYLGLYRCEIVMSGGREETPLPCIGIVMVEK